MHPIILCRWLMRTSFLPKSISFSSYVVSSCAVSFFFSSRRRHTRSDRDWSSDVCSSDLYLEQRQPIPEGSRGATSRGEVSAGRDGRRPANTWRSQGLTQRLELERPHEADREEARVGASRVEAFVFAAYGQSAHLELRTGTGREAHVRATAANRAGVGYAEGPRRTHDSGRSRALQARDTGFRIDIDDRHRQIKDPECRGALHRHVSRHQSIEAARVPEVGLFEFCADHRDRTHAHHDFERRVIFPEAAGIRRGSVDARLAERASHIEAKRIECVRLVDRERRHDEARKARRPFEGPGATCGNVAHQGLPMTTDGGSTSNYTTQPFAAGLRAATRSGGPPSVAGPDDHCCSAARVRVLSCRWARVGRR